MKKSANKFGRPMKITNPLHPSQRKRRRIKSRARRGLSASSAGGNSNPIEVPEDTAPKSGVAYPYRDVITWACVAWRLNGNSIAYFNTIEEVEVLYNSIRDEVKGLVQREGMPKEEFELVKGLLEMPSGTNVIPPNQVPNTKLNGKTGKPGVRGKDGKIKTSAVAKDEEGNPKPCIGLVKYSLRKRDHCIYDFNGTPAVGNVSIIKTTYAERANWNLMYDMARGKVKYRVTKEDQELIDLIVETMALWKFEDVTKKIGTFAKMLLDALAIKEDSPGVDSNMFRILCQLPRVVIRDKARREYNEELMGKCRAFGTRANEKPGEYISGEFEITKMKLKRHRRQRRRIKKGSVHAKDKNRDCIIDGILHPKVQVFEKDEHGFPDPEGRVIDEYIDDMGVPCWFYIPGRHMDTLDVGDRLYVAGFIRSITMNEHCMLQEARLHRVSFADIVEIQDKPNKK